VTSLESVLRRWPVKGSPIPGLIRACARVDGWALTETSALREALGKGKRAAAEARALVAAAAAFTRDKVDPDHDATHELLFSMIEAPPAALIAPLAAAYPTLPRRGQCAVLALLGAIGTRAAARALRDLIAGHGWPPSVYPRVFSEMGKLVRFSDELFPALLERAGDQLGDVTDLLLAAIHGGHLSPAKLAPLAPALTDLLETTLDRAAKLQQKTGVAWRYAEAYWPHRSQGGALLDVAAHLDDPRVDRLLDRAARLADPWLVTFAVASLVGRRREVPPGAIARAAAAHDTRAVLHDLLDRRGALALFPKPHRTLAAFAAADMVQWLSHPGELGQPPEKLEEMARLGRGDQVVFVWRFQSASSKAWKAAISGPYPKRASGPVRGRSTFSRFDAWKGKSPAEHAAAIDATLAAWRAVIP
jgi:hypothetical protein